jgi:hypothetical protein
MVNTTIGDLLQALTSQRIACIDNSQDRKSHILRDERAQDSIVGHGYWKRGCVYTSLFKLEYALVHESGQRSEIAAREQR